MDEITVIVAGAPHSGTSLIAGTLHKLGIHMGTRWINPGTFEDSDFFGIEEDQDFINLVLERNLKYKKWGIKFPPICKFLWQNAFIFKNLNIIYPCRNLLDIEKKYGEGAILRHLSYNGFWGAFLSTFHFPCLFVDYDSSIKCPENLVDSMINFLKLDVDGFTRSDAITFNNGGTGYNTKYK